jgi:hypothetical protein
MLLSIAPLGISSAARVALELALDLTLAMQRRDCERDPAKLSDPVLLGLLSAAVKLVSPDLEVLEAAPECEGLLKLLTLAEDMIREDARVRGVPLADSERPDLEIADLRRRASYVMVMPPGRQAAPVCPAHDLSMSWKEAS